MTAQIILFPPSKTPIVKDVTVEGEVLEGEVVSKPKGYEFTPAMANRFFHHAEAAPVNAAPKKKRRKQRAKKRVEQIDATCTRVPHRKHQDLRRCAGLLTIDFKGDEPYEITFDPDDESIENVVAPVEGYKRDAKRVEIVSNEGIWVWTLNEAK